MIPKAQILALATEGDLRPTTIEKDYALGWILYGVALHSEASKWVFKGGTCLKKMLLQHISVLRGPRFHDSPNTTVWTRSDLEHIARRNPLG